MEQNFNGHFYSCRTLFRIKNALVGTWVGGKRDKNEYVMYSIIYYPHRRLSMEHRCSNGFNISQIILWFIRHIETMCDLMMA